MQDGQDEDPPKLCSDEPGLAACNAAAAREVGLSAPHGGRRDCSLSFGDVVSRVRVLSARWPALADAPPSDRFGTSKISPSSKRRGALKEAAPLELVFASTKSAKASSFRRVWSAIFACARRTWHARRSLLWATPYSKEAEPLRSGSCQRRESGATMTSEVYVSTDVEADGPIPGPNSMLSCAAAAFSADKELIGTFAATSRPSSAQATATLPSAICPSDGSTRFPTLTSRSTAPSRAACACRCSSF